MHTRLVLFGVIGLLTAAASPQSPHALPDFPASPTSASVRFKLYRDYIIVAQGSIGELQNLNFLLDTGANPTAIDRKLAKKLRLVPEKAARLTLLNQNAWVEEVVLPSVQLGPIRADSLPAVEQNLDPIATFLGVRIDAIIGFGVLSQRSFAIDYAAKKILFGNIEPSTFSAPLSQGPATFTVRFQIQGHPVSLLVDTGSDDLILFACQLSPNMRSFVTRGTQTSLNSEGKAFHLWEVWVSQVRVGAADIGVKRALISENDVNCGKSLDGVVGPTSLGLKWIAFDFDHLRFSWR